MGLRVLSLGFWDFAQGFGSRVFGSGVGFWGSAWGLGFRVWGLA